METQMESSYTAMKRGIESRLMIQEDSNISFNKAHYEKMTSQENYFGKLARKGEDGTKISAITDGIASTAIPTTNAQQNLYLNNEFIKVNQFVAGIQDGESLFNICGSLMNVDRMSGNVSPIGGSFSGSNRGINPAVQQSINVAVTGPNNGQDVFFGSVFNQSAQLPSGQPLQKYFVSVQMWTTMFRPIVLPYSMQQFEDEAWGASIIYEAMNNLAGKISSVMAVFWLQALIATYNVSALQNGNVTSAAGVYTPTSITPNTCPLITANAGGTITVTDELMNGTLETAAGPMAWSPMVAALNILTAQNIGQTIRTTTGTPAKSIFIMCQQAYYSLTQDPKWAWNNVGAAGFDVNFNSQMPDVSFGTMGARATTNQKYQMIKALPQRHFGDGVVAVVLTDQIMYSAGLIKTISAPTGVYNGYCISLCINPLVYQFFLSDIQYGGTAFPTVADNSVPVPSYIELSRTPLCSQFLHRTVDQGRGIFAKPSEVTMVMSFGSAKIFPYGFVTIETLEQNLVLQDINNINYVQDASLMEPLAAYPNNLIN